MIKKPDNPKDDPVPALEEILKEIVRNLPDHQHVLVTGFSVTPGPAIPPKVFRLIKAIAAGYPSRGSNLSISFSSPPDWHLIFNVHRMLKSCGMHSMSLLMNG